MESFSDPPHLLQGAPPIQVPLASHIQDGGPGSASAVTGSGVIRSATDDWSVRRAAAFLVAGVTGPSKIKLQESFQNWNTVLKKQNIYSLSRSPLCSC